MRMRPSVQMFKRLENTATAEQEAECVLSRLLKCPHIVVGATDIATANPGNGASRSKQGRAAGPFWPSQGAKLQRLHFSLACAL